MDNERRGVPVHTPIDHPEALKQINRSGFPFQLRIEHEIRRTQPDHQWKVASREHAWSNPETESSGFIDIVLEHSALTTLRLVIECKRIKATDGRQLRWLFLLSPEEADFTRLASCFEIQGRGSTAAVLDRPGGAVSNPWEDMRIWDDVRTSPHSLQSGFCVLAGDDQGRQPILESLACEVLESVEGLAREEINIVKSQDSRHVRLFIFPAVVTNAELVVCRFSSSNVKIEDGTLDGSDVDMFTVPFIRFRKSLATEFPDERVVSNLEIANRARERTVFIVNGASLPEFLRNWSLQDLRGGYTEFAIQQLLLPSRR